MKLKSVGAKGAAGFGPNPWQQISWDWRAAGNFICGGAGTGLLIASVLYVPSATVSTGVSSASIWLLFVGLALVGLGLFSVWLEIGRPLRALHVFLNPHTSWMSREAFVGVLLFPSGLLAMLGFSGWNWVTAGLALLFLYCQSRMLPAARGIPAWRSVWLSPLFLVTAGVEGLALFVLFGLWHEWVSNTALLALAVLLAARLLVWRRYRQSVAATLAPRANRALDQAGRRLVLLGSVVPLCLLGIGWLAGGTGAGALLALAGAGAAWAGANLKYTLITRASFNQGFALTHIPVRGVRGSQ